MSTVYEPARSIPVAAEADVVVAGGGVAGVAAALAARRAGASVLLLEKECGVGGLATLGNVIVYLPLCDGRGHQVVGGLGEELLRLSVARVGKPIPGMRVGRVPECWDRDAEPGERIKQRFRVAFNPLDFQLDLENLLQREGVSLLYDVRCCGVSRENGRIAALLAETKGGRCAVAGRAFVDATGDADLCALAGEPTETLGTNVPCGWYYAFDPDSGGVQLHCMTKSYDEAGGPPADGGRTFAGDSVQGVTGLVLESHRLMRAEIDARRQESGHDVVPIHIPGIPCFRMTRRLKGAVELSETDDHRFFDDAVGMTGDWRRPGPIYSIPLGMLAAVNSANLLVAGRCVSANGRAWDAVRAIPTCVVTGQAAGTAAAMLARQRDKAATLRALDVAELQRRLRQAGVILDAALLEANG